MWKGVGNLIKALEANAWNASEVFRSEFLVMSVSNEHILSTRIIPEGGSKIMTGLFLIHVPPVFMFCGGAIVGKIGEGVMQAMLFSFIERNDENVFNYLQLFGAAPVFKAASVVDKEPWTIPVVTQFGIAIQDFAARVLEKEEGPKFTKPTGNSGILSLAPGKDSDSINRHAAVYKHCDKIFVAQATDSMSWRDVENARAEEMITVSVSEWGLALVVCWSLLLRAQSVYFLYSADRRGMPTAVDGEVHIALRWAKCEDTNL